MKAETEDARAMIAEVQNDLETLDAILAHVDGGVLVLQNKRIRIDVLRGIAARAIDKLDEVEGELAAI